MMPLFFRNKNAERESANRDVCSRKPPNWGFAWYLYRMFLRSARLRFTGWILCTIHQPKL